MVCDSIAHKAKGQIIFGKGPILDIWLGSEFASKTSETIPFSETLLTRLF